jgi:hypothetical protein
MTFVWNDLRRLTIDPDLIAVCLPRADSSAHPSVFVADICGGLGGRSGELAQGSTFMHRFFAGDKTSFKCSADCDAPHIRFRPARVKGPAETKSTEAT